MLKEELDAAAGRHPDVAYQPVLIDALYAGLLSGAKTPDLGGHAGTTEFTTAVIERIRTKIEVWSSLGSAA